MTGFPGTAASTPAVLLNAQNLWNGSPALKKTVCLEPSFMATASSMMPDTTWRSYRVVSQPDLPIVGGCAHIQAEVVYFVREEMAVSLEDILSMRLGLQLYDWSLAVQAAPVVARILERELGWSPAKTQAEIACYVDSISRSLQALGREPVSPTGPGGGLNDEVHRRA